jgi:ribosomal protein L40E
MICIQCTNRESYTRFGELCRPCYEKNLRLKNPEYAERQRKNNREWIIKNPDKVKAARDRRKADPTKCARDKATHLRCRLKRSYNLTVEEYKNLIANGCEICGNKKHLHIDHIHGTKIVRGVLCSACNNGLGFFGDNIEGLAKAMIYLTKGIEDPITGEIYK